MDLLFVQKAGRRAFYLKTILTNDDECRGLPQMILPVGTYGQTRSGWFLIGSVPFTCVGIHRGNHTRRHSRTIARPMMIRANNELGFVFRGTNVELCMTCMYSFHTTIIRRFMHYMRNCVCHGHDSNHRCINRSRTRIRYHTVPHSLATHNDSCGHSEDLFLSSHIFAIWRAAPCIATVPAVSSSATRTG